MKTVGSREFKNRQAHYLRRVRRGETLLVTARGKPLAEVIPPQGQARTTPTLEERLRELAAQGHLRLGRRGPWPRFKPVPLRGKPLSQMIIEDRRK